MPALALAEAQVSGSESSRFAQVYSQHGATFAVLASFVSGFIASLTPCVYPMIPITVSIFGATTAGTRRRGAALSLTFVLGIAALFTPMGILSALTGKLMGSALSNAFVVCGLALLFVALSASMFGAFELALPSSVNNRLSTVGGVGFRGAFVMGLVMGLIAAPCTGPFLTGMITVIASSKNVALGSASLFAFALGLGVLFFIAGAFAVALPKGGAWMMGIKWASGVGLAYMAFATLRDRFESVRALVSHPSYAFGITAGCILLFGLGLGLLHVAAERRKSPIAHLSKPAKLASILPAVVGCTLFVSWLPQSHTSDSSAPPIAWTTSESEGLRKAAAEGRPTLIDFGAEWCAACKELEHETFPDPAVRSAAAKFVAIHIDATDDENAEVRQLQAKYRVVGLPTVLLLDRSGKEVARFVEFIKPPAFAAALRTVTSD